MIECKLIDNSMDPNQKWMVEWGCTDSKRHRRLVGKLIYHTITRFDISFAVRVVSQFMQAPHIDH